MKQGTTEPGTRTYHESKPERTPKRGRPKSLTSREYFAGVFVGLLMSKAYELTPDIKKEAYRMADFMVEDDD